MRPLTLPVLLLALNGCAALAIPPAFSIMSYAVDGFSYLASGKSLTDHAISDAAGRDCATWRIIKGKAICRDFTPKQLAERQRKRREVDYSADRAYIATSIDGIETTGGGGSAVAVRTETVKQKKSPTVHKPAPKALAKRERRTVPVARSAVKRFDLGASPKQATSQPRRAVVKETPRRAAKTVVAYSGRQLAGRLAKPGERYLVFGSFRRLGDASRFASRHAAVKPLVVSAVVRGKRFYRVVVRPAGRQALAEARQTLRRSGVRNAYTMRVCTSSGGSKNCMPGTR